MASVLSSTLLLHCFVRDFIQDNGLCNVLNETDRSELSQAKTERYGDQFFRVLDQILANTDGLLRSWFSRNRSFQRCRYSKCHICGNYVNVDGIEVF